MAAGSEVLKLIIEGVDKFSGVFGSLEQKITGGRTGLDAMAHIGLKAAEAVAKLGVAAVAAGAGLAALSAKFAADFQQKMAEVSTLITGVAEKDLPLVRKGILDLSTEVPQSAVVLTDAFYKIQSATGLGAEAMKILEAAARGAVAGVTDVNTYSQAMLAVMKPFKLGVEDAARAADFLQNIIKEGSVKAEDLAANLGKVASVAAASGTDLDTLGAMLAVITNETQNVEQSFTYLRGAMLTFQKPTDDAKAAMEEFGIKTEDASGKIRPLIDILEDIAAKKLSLNEIMRIVPEREAAQSILQMANSYDVLREKQESMRSSQGVMMEAFDKMMGTFINQAKLMWNSIKALGIVIGENLLGTLGDIVKFVKEGIDWIRKWEEETGTIKRFMEGLRETVQANLQAVRQAFNIETISGFLRVIMEAVGWFAKAATSIDNIKLGLTLANGILSAIVIGVTAIHDSWKLIQTAVGGWIELLQRGYLWIDEKINRGLLLALEIMDKIPLVDMTGPIKELQERIQQTRIMLDEPWETKGPELWTGKALDALGSVQVLIDQMGTKPIIPQVDAKPAVDAIDAIGTALDKAAAQGEKLPDAIKKATEEAKKLTEEQEFKLKLTLIETDARVKIQQMQDETDLLRDKLKLEVQLNTEAAKVDMEKLKVQFESFQEITKSISDDMGALVKGISGAGSLLEKWEMADRLERALAMQQKLVDAQVALMEAQRRALDDPQKRVREHIIRVVEADTTWLAGFVNWLLDRMKLQIEEEGFECLCST